MFVAESGEEMPAALPPPLQQLAVMAGNEMTLAQAFHASAYNSEDHSEPGELTAGELFDGQVAIPGSSTGPPAILNPSIGFRKYNKRRHSSVSN